MKKVIDANYFQDPALTDYLRSDINNFVVFPDYACMEAYKGNAIKNISNSVEIVSQFPEQVIVLKGTRDIVKLSLLPDGFNKFEDPSQTREFKTFCHRVSLAMQGDFALVGKILQHGQLASEHFNELLQETEAIVEGIEEISKSFKPDHLRALRKRKKLETETVDSIIRNIVFLTGNLLQNHPGVDEMPKTFQLPYSYTLRYAVSAYLLILHWISDGGPGNVKREKLRNDFIDMHYVAYATFYDGLLTRDAKMKRIYQETCIILENVFDV